MRCGYVRIGWPKGGVILGISESKSGRGGGESRVWVLQAMTLRAKRCTAQQTEAVVGRPEGGRGQWKQCSRGVFHR